MIFFVAVSATPASRAMFGRAEILVPEPEDGLWVYKAACEEEIKRRFVAELKRDYPEANEDKLSEKVTVLADDERSTIVLFVKAEDAETAVADAMRMARMAVLKFMDMDESGRNRLLERIAKERARLEETITQLERKLLSAQTASGLYDCERQIEFLANRIGAFTDELELAELRRAQLQARLELLADKAARTSETVSFDEVAFLQEKAREVELRIDEAAQSYGQKHPKTVGLREQLAKIEDDLAEAKEELSETGGANLAPIIAEKKLECETEMVSVEAMIERLRPRIEELRREIRHKQSNALELRRRQAEIGALEERVLDLRDEERRLHTHAVAARRPEIISVKVVESIEQ